MPTILPSGQKLGHIELLVNWFESHRIIGPIHSAFAEYKELSGCTYVEATASVVVTGPKELANRWSVDEIALIRAKQKGFLKDIQEAAVAINITNPLEISVWKHMTLRPIQGVARANACRPAACSE